MFCLNLLVEPWPILFVLLRKEQKRSHTLRYVLKNRATDRILFVVLFTLYLKEDVDEKGNPKEGVETGVPFHLMDDKDREKYESKKNGLDGGEEEETDEQDGEGETEGSGEKKAQSQKDDKFYADEDGVD